VIRVGIAPARWFSDDHAGAQPANDSHKAAHRLARGSLGKRVPVLIRGCPRHLRIPVAQHAHLCDPKQSTHKYLCNPCVLPSPLQMDRGSDLGTWPTTRVVCPCPVRSCAICTSPGPKRWMVPFPRPISASPDRVIMYCRTTLWDTIFLPVGRGQMEKGVDQIIGARQKHKGMSWSSTGSKALGIFKVVELN
jgi:hypothetical protein